MQINKETSYTLQLTQEELNTLYQELDAIDDDGQLKGLMRSLYSQLLEHQD